MIRYYCSGLDNNKPFENGIGDMLKKELKRTKNILYIPAGFHKLKRLKEIHIPLFTKSLKNSNIIFDNIYIITTKTTKNEAKEFVDKADIIMLMGGDPFKQKEICENLDIIENLKKFTGIILGISAGAMFMSKYIYNLPWYPGIKIEKGLNLDNISIHPHNNILEEEYPKTLKIEDETFVKEDLIKVAKEYGNFYLLQDVINKENKFDISLIKVVNGKIEYYIENNGKIWLATDKDIKLLRI